MKYILSALTFFSVIFFSFTVATAQGALQLGTQNQQQTQNSQNALSPQNNSAQTPQNSGGNVFNQGQIQSLDVVGNPDQSNPSVSVGPTSSSTSRSEIGSSNTNVLTIILGLVVVLIIVGGVIRFFFLRPSSNTEYFSGSEIQSDSQEEKTEYVEKPKKPKSKKKKKKKAHHR